MHSYLINVFLIFPLDTSIISFMNGIIIFVYFYACFAPFTILIFHDFNVNFRVGMFLLVKKLKQYEFNHFREFSLLQDFSPSRNQRTHKKKIM